MKEWRMRIPERELPADLRAIETALRRALVELPALSSILESFGPLLVERTRLRHEAPGWSGPAPVVDAQRFCQGVFLLADSGFEDMSAHLPGAARRLLPLMARCFPALAQELNALKAAIDSGALAPEVLAAVGFGEVITVPQVNPETLGFVAAELVRPFVERQAQELAQLVKDLPWRQTYCPVCGGSPNMSVLRRTNDESEYIQAHGGRRFLRCSSCVTEWSYKRVSCPTCGCEEPDGLVVLRDPARPHERADACRRCHTFLLCLDTGELADIPDPDVAALTMLPLALQARRQGFTPQAEHPWSDLQAR
jgi:FdhE protein